MSHTYRQPHIVAATHPAQKRRSPATRPSPPPPTPGPSHPHTRVSVRKNRYLVARVDSDNLTSRIAILITEEWIDSGLLWDSNSRVAFNSSYNGEFLAQGYRIRDYCNDEIEKPEVLYAYY
ncbi:unnamed protein product [Sphenostylis stenocarpa]|uniref:Uncharacterized protein n=1 Tax=Sphenostylis stenocarpa TaxID=92480 RepID=A0AA86SQ18_9FABA|nr:unnamed protein product [Sphenostylis stenocarpa]